MASSEAVTKVQIPITAVKIVSGVITGVLEFWIEVDGQWVPIAAESAVNGVTSRIIESGGLRDSIEKAKKGSTKPARKSAWD